MMVEVDPLERALKQAQARLTTAQSRLLDCSGERKALIRQAWNEGYTREEIAAIIGADIAVVYRVIPGKRASAA